MDNGFWACLIIGSIWAATGKSENKGVTWTWYGMAIAVLVIEQIAK